MSFSGNITKSKMSIKKSEKKKINDDTNTINTINQIYMDMTMDLNNSKSGTSPLESGTTPCESNPSSIDTNNSDPLALKPSMWLLLNDDNNDTDTDTDTVTVIPDSNSLITELKNNGTPVLYPNTNTQSTDTNLNSTDNKDNKDNKYVCIRCQKEFNSKSHLTQHYKKKFLCVKNTTNVNELTTKPSIDITTIDDHKNMSELFTNYKQINQQLVQQNIMLTNKINAITAILFPTNSNNNEI